MRLHVVVMKNVCIPKTRLWDIDDKKNESLSVCLSIFITVNVGSHQHKLTEVQPAIVNVAGKYCV